MTFNAQRAMTLITVSIAIVIVSLFMLLNHEENRSATLSKQDLSTKSEITPLHIEQKDTVEIEATHQSLKKSKMIEANHSTSKEIITEEEKSSTTLKPHHLHQPSAKEREAMLLRRIAHQDREKKMKMIREKLHAEHEEKLNND